MQNKCCHLAAATGLALPALGQAARPLQTQGVGQVGQAVQQLDHSTQQNAALVEQGAAAAQSLQQQASALVQAVAVFELAPADR